MNPRYLPKIQSTALMVLAALAMSALTACGGGNKTTSTTSPPQISATGVVVSPSTVAVGVSGAQHFTATVSPSGANQAVTWGVSGPGCSGASCGAIDPNGNYTAPATLPNPATIMVSATSVADPTKAGAASIALFAKGAFNPIGNMTVARADHSATLLPDGRVLIAGGYSSAEVLATAELFDPATGTFTPTGAMTSPRFWHTATLLANGKVLITGGSSNFDTVDSSGELATAELFDPATKTFTATGTMSEVRSEHTATLLANGKVLVAGGAADNVAELFDPVMGTFTPTSGKLTTAGRWGCTATLLNDGTVLIAGGRDALDVYDAFSLNNAELFNPATGTFVAIGGMTEVRYDHSATLLKNGKVLIAGGFNGAPSPSAELFDPGTESFSATGAMGTARAQHSATLLEDGTVLLTGGFSSSSPSISSAELFVPATNTFVPTGAMATGRFFHTATRLESGMVLVTGGVSNTSVPVDIASSAELY